MLLVYIIKLLYSLLLPYKHMESISFCIYAFTLCAYGYVVLSLLVQQQPLLAFLFFFFVYFLCKYKHNTVLLPIADVYCTFKCILSKTNMHRDIDCDRRNEIASLVVYSMCIGGTYTYNRINEYGHQKVSINSELMPSSCSY